MRTVAAEAVAPSLAGEGSASSVNERRSMGQGAGASKAVGLRDQGAMVEGPRTMVLWSAEVGSSGASDTSRPRLPCHDSSVITYDRAPSACVISRRAMTPAGLRCVGLVERPFVASISISFSPVRSEISAVESDDQLVDRSTMAPFTLTTASLSAATAIRADTTPAGASKYFQSVTVSAGALFVVGLVGPESPAQTHFASGPGSTIRFGAIHLGSWGGSWASDAGERRERRRVIAARSGRWRAGEWRAMRGGVVGGMRAGYRSGGCDVRDGWRGRGREKVEFVMKQHQFRLPSQPGTGGTPQCLKCPLLASPLLAIVARYDVSGAGGRARSVRR